MIFDIFYNYFDHPLILVFIIPLFFVLLMFIRKDFVTFAEGGDQRRNMKFWFFLSRFVLFTLLFIALASPFLFEEKLVKGDPFVKILVDNSTSFDLFDHSIGEHVYEETKKEVKSELAFIGSGETSNIGDKLLENMKTGGTILLVSDGQNNKGSDLGDITLYANKQNTTINVLRLSPVNHDWMIEIFGPSKTTANVENSYLVNIKGTDEKEHRVNVAVDGKTVLSNAAVTDSVSFSQSFDKGYHRITAELVGENDHFAQNNIFYKTVKVVPKPKVLLYTLQETPLSQLFKEIYDIDIVNSLPASLDPYYAIIANDIPAVNLDGYSKELNDYVSDGNGLVVFGGKRSYEKGGYKDSVIERTLPVVVASAGKQEGETSIVIVIDISGSTSGGFGEGSDTAADVQKALALNIINTLNNDNRLGVVAFHTDASVVSPLEYLIKKDSASLESKIKSLQPGGGTLIGAGIHKATEMLVKSSGSKNIILISDGNTQGKSAALAAAQEASSLDVKIFTVGVGTSTSETTMKQIADIGSGSYFKITELNKIKILFGDSEGSKNQDSFGVVLLDENHFITQHLEGVPGKIYGYNEAVPKSTSKLLVTTSTGDPLISVWYFGLGKVAALLTDDGTIYASELLSEENSALFVRSVNWVIGDPERKSKNYVDARDTRIGDVVEILYKSSKQPTSPEVNFYKIEEDTYQGSLPTTAVGHQSILGADFSVNYHLEYEGIGMNPELNNLIYGTGGEYFSPEDIEGIVGAVKQQSKRSSYQKWYYRWPFVLAAIIIFLFDIFVRRMAQYKHI